MRKVEWSSLRLLFRWWELLFPRRCKACDLPLLDGETMLCTTCEIDFPYTGFEHQKGNPVERMFRGRVKIHFASSLFFFEKGRVYRQIIHKFKYQGDKEMAFRMGIRLGESISQSEWYPMLDWVTFVPLHERKYKSRGYNQSEQIANGVAQVLGISVEKVLKRIEDNPSQTGKDRFQRNKNVREAFVPEENHPLLCSLDADRQANVLIVDDVLTTGSTLEACAKALITKNCRIYMATLAYAL